MTDRAAAPIEGAEATDTQGMNYLVSLPRKVVTIYAPLAAFLIVLLFPKVAMLLPTLLH